MNIVLVYGILGFDRIGPISYFNGVADRLRLQFGASVHATALDPTAGTGPRSTMLRQSIQEALSRRILDFAQPIHIIAHSIGGLDARHMTSQDAAIQAAKMRLGNALEHFRISLDGLHDLTTKSARDFNTQFPNHLGVQYLSYAGGGRPGLLPTSGFFLPYYEFIRTCEGEVSDGVVGICERNMLT